MPLSINDEMDRVIRIALEICLGGTFNCGKLCAIRHLDSNT